ncbi:MAG: tRNA (adenine-N1)-methyltransferase [Acidimicrobiales bacterium]|nr:MAG: tRNA (adenine-N1)-methyltransferase [Acidimicrobiales bacterium]
MGAAAELRSGDWVVFVDRKGRRALTRLREGQRFHSHRGWLDHDAVVGLKDGAAVRTSTGATLRVWRATLADYVLKMRRGAQVVYPKDLAQIVFMADIQPGVHVVEAGVGSGALSMALLRAGARVTAYEIREDFASLARENVTAFLGEEALQRWTLRCCDIYEGIAERDVDRILLDLPEPWRVVEHASESLRPGGIILAYTPSVMQVSQFRDALAAHGFELAETVEVLVRPWHVEHMAVRPDHRMVAHTGFISCGRLPGDVTPRAR